MKIYEGLSRRLGQLNDEKLRKRLEQMKQPGEKIRYGCRFSGEKLVTIRISEDLEGNEKLARELYEVVEKENIRRAYLKMPLIAYKIETSGNMADQFPDVAAGGFELESDTSVIQAVAMGHYIFPSSPVGGEE